MRVASTEGVAAALWFSVGAVMAESVYVAASVFVVDRMLSYARTFRFLHWFSAIFLMTLAVVSFVAAVAEKPISVIPLDDRAYPLIFGFGLMFMNPVQLPFWVGWITLLAEKRILNVNARYVLSVGSAALGSFLAALCFIWLGDVILSRWEISAGLFYYVLSGMFALSALIQFRRVWRTGAVNLKTDDFALTMQTPSLYKTPPVKQ